jgi:hypothetical protein
MDRIFDESPTDRLNASVSNVYSTLQSNKDGWIIKYYPSSALEFGGYTLFAKFTNGVDVTVEGDMTTLARQGLQAWGCGTCWMGLPAHRRVRAVVVEVVVSATERQRMMAKPVLCDTCQGLRCRCCGVLQDWSGRDLTDYINLTTNITSSTQIHMGVLQ